MMYAAFLRGVNVGGRKVLKGDLLAVFEGRGYGGVTTFLQSGNVVFESDETEVGLLRSAIEEGLQKRFAMRVVAFVYPLSSIAQLIADYPFERTEERHAYAVLTDGEVGGLLDNWSGSDVDQVAVSALGFYWSVPKGMTLNSPFAAYVSQKQIAEHTTTRNLNTLEKIARAGQGLAR